MNTSFKIDAIRMCLGPVSTFTLIAVMLLSTAAAADASTISAGPNNFRSAIKSARPGDVVKLQTGTYSIDAENPLVLSKSITIEGDGRRLTKIKCTGELITGCIQADGRSKANRPKVELRDLSIVGRESEIRNPEYQMYGRGVSTHKAELVMDNVFIDSFDSGDQHCARYSACGYVSVFSRKSKLVIKNSRIQEEGYATIDAKRGRVTVKDSVIEGFINYGISNRSSSINISKPNYVTFTNTILENNKLAVYGGGTVRSRVDVEGNTFTAAYIYISNASDKPTNANIRRNWINNGSIIVSSGTKTLIANNILEDGFISASKKVSVQPPAATYIRVLHNTLYDNPATNTYQSSSTWINVGRDLNGIVANNAIISRQDNGVLEVRSGEVANNIVEGVSSSPQYYPVISITDDAIDLGGNAVADIQFTNPIQGDFTAAVNSPLRDAAGVISVKRDYFKNLRPAIGANPSPDVGAIEN